jgi:hypothetical protein
MEKKTVLGSRITANGHLLILVADSTEPIYAGLLAGRAVPVSGSTVCIAKHTYNSKEYSDVYW